MRAAFKYLSGLVFLGFTAGAFAQQQEWIIEARDPGGSINFDLAGGFREVVMTYTNGVVVRYGNALLEADSATIHQGTGEVLAEGRVRVESEGMVWVGERVRYNFKTRQVQSEAFRAGQSPLYGGGQGVTGVMAGDKTNHVYTATNGIVTLDDYADPFFHVRCKRVKIVPGQKIVAHGATLYMGNVPVFFLPVYTQRLGATVPGFMVNPGYESRYGGYLLASYGWRWGQAADARVHLDYRSKRGLAGGPDLDLHLGRWGEAMFSYYYLHDDDPELDANLQPYSADRHRLEFTWLASPFTNTTFKSRVSYASDEGVRREFFEGDYRRNTQPNTFVEARHFWDNFSLSARAQPRVNDFFSSVERLPELKLTGFRQQIGATPFFYESESSAGYYRRRFSETNAPPGLEFEAARADTFHQVLLPYSIFGWLNFTPRAGGRLSYYGESDGPGATLDQQDRAVFNTGAELSTKISRLWAGPRNGVFDLDGVRHIMEPSVNYVYVPRPGARPNELPQFDYLLPSLQLLPMDFPDYNAIDAVDSQNVMRLGLRHRLQTKREGRVEEFLFWDVFADWRLDPEPGQTTWGDLWSDLRFKPRSWLAFESQNRFSLEDEALRLSYNGVTLQPGSGWSWRVGYFYLKDDFSTDPTAWGEGSESITSTLYFRLNENWGVRAAHYLNVPDGELVEQSYSLYRDFRSWTGALTVRWREEQRGEDNFSIGFTLSLKALPRHGVGADVVTRGLLMAD